MQLERTPNPAGSTTAAGASAYTRYVGAFFLIGVLAGTATAARGATVKGHVRTPTGEPVADAVVYVDHPADPGSADRAPDGIAPGDPIAVMDQVNKQFLPHQVVIPVGGAIRFPNHDRIHHHVYSFSRVKSFDLPLYRDEEPAPVRFDNPGVVRVGCNIHDSMSGVILVVPNQYFAVTESDGSFVLDKLPSSTHRIVVWHERSQRSVDDTARSVDTTVAEPAPLELTLPLDPEPEKTAEPVDRGY